MTSIKKPSISIVIVQHPAVIDIKVFSVDKENATMNYLCTVAELQNMSCSVFNSRITNVFVLCPIIFLYDFNQIWILSTKVRTSRPVSDFTKVRPVGAALT